MPETAQAPRRHEATDAQLMAGVHANDPRAFGALYDRYATRAWRVAHSICHDANRAEDAMQEAFLAVWRSPASYRGDLGSVQVWLMTIVRNRAIDSVRRESAARRPRLIDRVAAAEEAAGGSTTDEVIARSEAEALRGLLACLPDPQAQVIALAYYGGLSHAEIAVRLSLPPGTVKGRMRLGLQKLREQLAVAP